MYPTLDHLIAQDEGGIDYLVDEEREEIRNMLEKDGYDKRNIEFRPIKNSKVANVRTRFEGEKRKSKSLFSMFSCMGC